MIPIRASALLLLAAGAACQAAGSQDPGPRIQAAQTEEEAAAERHLRRMFPGIQGEITREAIAEELLRERTDRDPSAGVRAAASQAIETGDFDRARDLLGELLAGTHVERARVLAGKKDAGGALAALDAALEMAPHSATILCARAETALDVAGPARDAAILASALGHFLEVARRDPGADEGALDLRARAWLGASRAASALGRREEALEYARNGVEAWPRTTDGERLEVPLRRTFAETSLDAYLGAARNGAAADRLRERARESRDALVGLLGRTPEDPWAWERLAELSRAQGLALESRDVALRGLAITPDDAPLLEDLALAARETGGPRGVVLALEPFCSRHPDVAEAAFRLAQARYDLAAASAMEGVDPRAELAAAEAGFARARALEPALEDRSREMEARCRGALGAWHLDHGDLQAARDAFLSMEDARKGGLALEIGGGVGRGSDGLFRVAQAYADRGDAGGADASESIEHLEQSALIFDLLHAGFPDDARVAFGAGHANREAAVALELRARGLVRSPDDERNGWLDHAREMMERGFRALEDAAKLAPEDPRIAAEAGAMLVRYLQRDPERARALLEKAVELGEAEVRRLAASADEAGLDEAERGARRLRLEEAQTRVGDACLDLGTLHLAWLGDAGRAEEWFERSRRAGPDPRPEIDGLLERCRAARAGEIDPRIQDENRWAAPVRPGR